MKIKQTLETLRTHIRKNDFQFTDTIYPTLKTFSELSTPQWLQETTPEYTQEEYLRNVTKSGDAIQLSPAVQADIQSHPVLQNWFFIFNNTPYITRWLAHLCGFRHRCIHLFLDPQDQSNTTYVQVRSLKKYNEPGGFDMPVAGHVSGQASFLDGLHAEASEELGLNLKTDVTNLRQIHTHNIVVTPLRNMPNYFDVEHTAIYRATLTKNAYHHIRFTDGEVAALAQFQVSELATLIQKYPERVAGGLRDSFPFYQKDNTNA